MPEVAPLNTSVSLPRPVGFSFADSIAASLSFGQPECPVPFAVSYRVGEPVPEGTVLAVRRQPLRVGSLLPVVPLALDVFRSVPVDLEHTYSESARRLYLN